MTAVAQPKTIELFYDVGSTNSYFALHLLRRLADKYSATLVYQPFNLGYVFRKQNYVLMNESKAKLRNRKRDLQRWAERYDLPFRMPDQFPIKTSPALRGALAARHFGKEEAYLFAVFSRYWEHNDASVTNLESLAAIAATVGIDADDFVRRIDSAVVREQLIELTQSALDREIFGAPSIVLDGELYWGKDRMEFIESQLAAT